jgi:hypothetical protein
VTLPEYQIRIGSNPRLPEIPAASTRRDPIYPVGTALPAPNEPMIGARIEAVFAATAVGSTLRYVFLEERDRILVQAPIDFRILE